MLGNKFKVKSCGYRPERDIWLPKISFGTMALALDLVYLLFYPLSILNSVAWHSQLK